ncbi:MAG: hypothetical protein ACJ8BW_20790 [Ktedonobacteraceae bacterium]
MATQDGSIDVPDSSENADALSVSKTEAASEGDIDVEKANVDTLHRNAIGIVGLVAGAAGAVARDARYPWTNRRCFHRPWICSNTLPTEYSLHLSATLAHYRVGLHASSEPYRSSTL